MVCFWLLSLLCWHNVILLFDTYFLLFSCISIIFSAAFFQLAVHCAHHYLLLSLSNDWSSHPICFGQSLQTSQTRLGRSVRSQLRRPQRCSRFCPCTTHQWGISWIVTYCDLKHSPSPNQIKICIVYNCRQMTHLKSLEKVLQNKSRGLLNYTSDLLWTGSSSFTNVCHDDHCSHLLDSLRPGHHHQASCQISSRQN